MLNFFNRLFLPYICASFKKMQAITELIPLLDSPKNIVITHHNNADADALGSTLGLRLFLEKLGHTAIVVSPNKNPSFLNWLPGYNDILVFENSQEETQKLFDKSDILFCLDFNIFHRTKHLAPLCQHFEGTKVLIDHHLQPDEASFDYGISLPAKSSTCEMVYDFIQLFGHGNYLDKNIASALYIGAVADTGGFRYASTAPSTMVMAAELMKTGINISRIQESTFNTKSEKDLRLLGYVLSENMQLFPEHHAALITIPQAIYKKYNIQPGGTEGLVNFPLGIGNIIFSTFIVERDDEVKLSLRSQGNLDVSAIARQNFEGGGHKNAAGGRSDLSLSETIEVYKTILEKHKNEIKQCYEESQSVL